MAKKGIRKSKATKKASPKSSPEVGTPKDAEQPATLPTPEAEVPKPGLPTFQPETPMVNLRAKIHDIGMLSITVPAEKVDAELEKIWRTGFMQKLNNRQRTHQVYGPHMIDRIDVEPIIT